MPMKQPIRTSKSSFSSFPSLLLVKIHKMEKRSDKYYLYKNISIPSKKQYKTQLKSKVEKAIKRIRWKTMEFLRKLNSNKNTETYGSINKIPSSSGRTIKFENDILLVIKNIEFRKIAIFKKN